MLCPTKFHITDSFWCCGKNVTNSKPTLSNNKTFQQSRTKTIGCPHQCLRTATQLLSTCSVTLHHVAKKEKHGKTWFLAQPIEAPLLLGPGKGKRVDSVDTVRVAQMGSSSPKCVTVLTYSWSQLNPHAQELHWFKIFKEGSNHPTRLNYYTDTYLLKIFKVQNRLWKTSFPRPLES